MYVDTTRITPYPGGVSENECLNVAPNFIFGYLFLVVAFLLLLCYVLGYSYQEVVRRIETVLEPVRKISERMVLNTWTHKKHLQEEEEIEVYCSENIQRCKRLLRTIQVFIAQLLMFILPFFFIAFFVFFLLLRTFYCSIIIWRGQLPFKVTVIDAIDEFVKGLYFKEIESLFYPFIYFYKLLSLFQINLGGIDVTCSGAQLPLVLVTDLVVFTICLSITCTDFQVYADMFADILGNWADDVHTHDESERHCCYVFGSWLFRSVASIVRKIVSTLLSFTPLQRCESYYSIACCSIVFLVFYCVGSRHYTMQR